MDGIPEICTFFHLIIRMYAKENPPPHFDAIYGDYEGVFSISSGKLLLVKLKKWV